MYVNARTLGKIAAKSGSVPTVASQTQMEAATDTGTFVSPSVAKYHPGAAKAWVIFTTTGGTGTTSAGVTVAASHNVASVGRTAAGNFITRWTVPFSTANYVVLGMGQRSTAAQQIEVELLGTGSAMTATGAKLFTHVAGVAANPFITMVVAFGDQ